MGWVATTLLALAVFLVLWRFARFNQASLQLLAAACSSALAATPCRDAPY